ncbi:hypothetical protein YC2023_060344 [Brassica napus]
MTWVNRESPREPYPINYCLTFFICSMKMSCLVSLTCSFAPFDTSLTRPTHFIIISSPIVNKLIALSVHNHCVLYTTTVFCTQPLSSCLYVALDVNKNVAFLGLWLCLTFYFHKHLYASAIDARELFSSKLVSLSLG